jgi:hypothetical protein
MKEKAAAPAYEAKKIAMGICCADHATPSIRKSWN